MSLERKLSVGMQGDLASPESPTHRTKLQTSRSSETDWHPKFARAEGDSLTGPSPLKAADLDTIDESLPTLQSKILVLGSSSVGKTAILTRFMENSFSTSFTSTIGLDFKVRTVVIDGQRIRLQVWDTAGQERFRGITSAYYRNSHGAVFVYDICSEASFKDVRSWLVSFHTQAPDRAAKVLVGNKLDLDAERRVDTNAGLAFAEQHNMAFFESSAQTGQSIDDIFLCIARLIKPQAENDLLSETDRARALKASPMVHRKQEYPCSC